MFRKETARHHGRTAAAPVFLFVVGGDDDDLCGSCGPSRMGRLAAFLSAFHLSQAGVPAVSMRSVKIADDHLLSIVKLFFDPLSEKTSQLPTTGTKICRNVLNSIIKLDCQVSSLGFGTLLTSIASVGLAY